MKNHKKFNYAVIDVETGSIIEKFRLKQTIYNYIPQFNKRVKRGEIKVIEI